MTRSASATNRTGALRRRSNRMALKAAVGLTGEDHSKAYFSLTANATSLNRHGAAIQVARELPIGMMVQVRNNRGTKLSARVVTQVSTVPGKHIYGIEFVEDSDLSRTFWGINFPSNA
jgi:hypothetical protein